MEKPVVLQRRRRARRKVAADPDPNRSGVALLAAGAALAVVGWTDAALLWYPLGFGSAEWEFATTSTFFDALPLGTIGLVALAVGALARGSTWLLRLLGLAFPLLAVALVAVFALFVLNAVVAWNRVDPGFRVMLDRAVLKTSVLSMTYIVLYGWLGWIVRGRAETRSSGG